YASWFIRILMMPLLSCLILTDLTSCIERLKVRLWGLRLEQHCAWGILKLQRKLLKRSLTETNTHWLRIMESISFQVQEPRLKIYLRYLNPRNWEELSVQRTFIQGTLEGVM